MQQGAWCLNEVEATKFEYVTVAAVLRREDPVVGRMFMVEILLTMFPSFDIELQ